MLYYITQNKKQYRKQNHYSFVNKDTGEQFQIKGLKGCEYLYQLISNVGKAVSVLELFFYEKGVFAVRRNDQIKTVLESVYQDYYCNTVISPIFDIKTIREVKKELCKIIDQQAEAITNNDSKKAEELKERKDFLIDYLEKGFAENKRSKLPDQALQKVRNCIFIDINSVLHKIELYDPVVARHLRCSIQKGWVFTYYPIDENQIVIYPLK